MKHEHELEQKSENGEPLINKGLTLYILLSTVDAIDVIIPHALRPCRYGYNNNNLQ